MMKQVLISAVVAVALIAIINRVPQARKLLGN
jgi:hypothetical protein